MDNRDKVYSVITDRIIALLEAGTCPWRKPWTGIEPANLASRAEYRGINRLLLGSLAFPSPYFLTFKQALDAGGAVKKGEHGFPVVFWKMMRRSGGKDGAPPEPGTIANSDNTFPLIRYSTVFNVAQCEGIAAPPVPDVSAPVEPEPIVRGYLDRAITLRLEHGGGQAFYRPSDDLVQMPHPETFASRDAYRSTLFHELTHSTGHEKRLNRFAAGESHAFASSSYGREELIAEMGAAFLCGECGISQTMEDSAAYLASWMRALRQPKNVRLVVEAAGKAQRAADMILGREKEQAA